jgi:hypothetical protein
VIRRMPTLSLHEGGSAALDLVNSVFAPDGGWQGDGRHGSMKRSTGIVAGNIGPARNRIH